MEKVRFGLVGAGAIAASHITGIRNTEKAELSAVCEKNPVRLEELKKELGIPCFPEVGDMISSGLVDAVDITTPSGLHLEPALAAIEAGVHVLVEKPMEITTARIDSMIEAARKKGVRLGSVLQFRFREMPRRVKGLIDGGILGELYSGSAYRKLYRTQEYYDSGGWRGTWEIDGGGALMNQGIHTVDFLLWHMGEAEEVIGTAETKGRSDIEVETLSAALVKFKSGARGVIEATTLAYPGLPESVEIFGSKGTITFNSNTIFRFDLIDPSPEEKEARDELLARQEEAEKTKKTEPPGKKTGTVVTSADMGHTPIIEDFTEAVISGREPYVPPSEARRSVELITAVYESARTNSSPVRLGRGQ